MNTCPKCGKDTLRATVLITESVVPLDPAPDKDGNIRPIPGRAPYVEVIAGQRRREAAKAGAPLFRAHAATCPVQDKWERARVTPSGRIADDG